MNKHCFFKIAVLGAVTLSPAFGYGQYDTVFVGDPETISVGPFETPFPTSGAQTSRTQYRFSAEEIMAALSPNMSIEGVVIELLTSDPPGTTVDLELRMKNTVQTNSSSHENVGMLHTADTVGLHLDAGMLVIHFNTSIFLWTGAPFNVVLDIGMHRYGPPGSDPQVALDTSFTFIPTYYVHADGLFPLNEFSTLDAQYAASFDSRPVIGFLIPGTTSVGDGSASLSRAVVFPNPAGDHFSIQLIEPVDQASVQLFSSTGALARTMPLLSSTNGRWDIPLTGLAPGTYLLRIQDEALRPLWQQQIIVR